MKASEIREWDVETLERKADELDKLLFNFHMKKSAGTVLTTHVFKQLRRDIARINTIITEKKAKAAKDVIKG
jgi:large subunit ribosomal protein L29